MLGTQRSGRPPRSPRGGRPEVVAKITKFLQTVGSELGPHTTEILQTVGSEFEPHTTEILQTVGKELGAGRS
jgi:hypothetical protein